MDLINDVCDDSNRINTIDAIAVDIGPGSYTGLRIGLSTAKGLAFPRELPILSIRSLVILESIARHEWQEDLLLFIKSHRDFVYFTVSQAATSELNIVPRIEYATFTEAMAKYPGISNLVGDYGFSVPDSKSISIRYPNGAQTALLAWHNRAELLTQKTSDLEPEYISSMQLQKWKK